MKFKINNTTLQTGELPTAVFRMREELDRLKDGELLPYTELIARLGFSLGHAREKKGHPALADYWVLASISCVRMVLFGNPKTIRAYKKEFE